MVESNRYFQPLPALCMLLLMDQSVKGMSGIDAIAQRGKSKRTIALNVST